MYSSWTTLRLLHYWFWQPTYEDREAVGEELVKRGVLVDLEIKATYETPPQKLFVGEG